MAPNDEYNTLAVYINRERVHASSQGDSTAYCRKSTCGLDTARAPHVPSPTPVNTNGIMLLLETLVAASALPLMAAGETGCWRNGRECYWWGAATECGDTAFFLGDLDKGLYRLVTWTRDATIDELCANQGSSLNPGPNCCDAYGHGCWSGYKRLWCNARGVRCVAALPLSCFVWQPSCLGLRLTESIYMDV